MGKKKFYYIRRQKKIFYVVKFFFEKLKFFWFLSKIGATYSCEILGFSWKYHIYGGSLKQQNQFRRRPLLWNSHTRTGPWEPQKVPSGPTFLAIFLVFFYCHFLWGIIVILCIFVAKLTKSVFFFNFQKKIEMLVAPLFGPWHTSVFFLNPSKFSQLSFDDWIFTFRAIFHYIKKS